MGVNIPGLKPVRMGRLLLGRRTRVSHAAARCFRSSQHPGQGRERHEEEGVVLEGPPSGTPSTDIRPSHMHVCVMLEPSKHPNASYNHADPFMHLTASPLFISDGPAVQCAIGVPPLRFTFKPLHSSALLTTINQSTSLIPLVLAFLIMFFLGDPGLHASREMWGHGTRMSRIACINTDACVQFDSRSICAVACLTHCQPHQVLTVNNPPPMHPFHLLGALNPATHQ